MHQDPQNSTLIQFGRTMRAGITGLLSLIISVASTFAAAELPAVLRDNFGGVVRFDGANLPGTPFNNSFGGQTLQIDQTADRAVLHWESFNISQNNEVLFNQPRASSIALNRVLGDAHVASIINGHITANGRVFIINHDGLLFGDNAVVDTRSFIASTLNISDDVFLDIGFESAINELQSTNPRDGTPAFTMDTSLGRPMGEINIAAGAHIQSAKNGRVLMFAPTITNNGSIVSPDGQIALAAAEDEVYIAAAGENDDLRGLIIGVRTGGEVGNLGSLIAEHGNVSLLGLAVNQNGLARATTGVSLNGSVMLLAQDMNGNENLQGRLDGSNVPQATRAGELVLGSGSVTEVVPDDSGATAPDAQVQKASVINLKAEKVRLQNDSRITVTGGNVSIEASSTPDDSSVFNGLSDPDLSLAEIIVESGALIDVSGDEQTVVSVARNFVEVEARGNELADSPLQRDGPVRDKKLTVDIRKGTDFLNIEGALASIERDVHERLSPGGSIEIKTTGQVTIDQGATVDISGGKVTDTGDRVAPSQLVTADGLVHNIADADPNLLYSGVLDIYEVEHEKWGVTETYEYATGHFEEGYIEGRDAGVLNINAPGISFTGNLVADTTAGIHQRLAPDELGGSQFNALTRSYDQVPLGGKLVIKHLNNELQDLIIGEDDGTLAAENDHPLSAVEALVLAPQIFTDGGVSRVEIDNAGRIIINRPLEMAAFSDFDLLGTQVMVQSDMRLPGGTVTLGSSSNLNGLFSDGVLGSAFADARTSLVKVDSTIDVSGSWINDSAAVNYQISSAPVVTQGGNISIESGRDVVTTADSLLDVSGGAWLEHDGKFTGGRGGDITLSSWTSENDVTSVISRLDIQGELRGFGMASGGSLVLDAEAIQIQDSVTGPLNTNYSLNGAQQFALIPGTGNRNILTVAADTFQQGGFQSFELNAVRSSLEILPGTQIDLTVANTVPDAAGIQSSTQGVYSFSNNFDRNGHPLELVPTGTSLAAFTGIDVVPDHQRTAVDLTLSSGPFQAGALTIGTGAGINADAGARIELNGQNNIFIDGVVSAPAGNIGISLAGNGGTIQSIQNRIWLGAHAGLLAPGAVKVNPINNFGLQIGEVLDAGTVSIRTDYGSIVGAPGAVINVDAVSSELDIGNFGIFTNSAIGGEAGTIAFSAAESLVYTGVLSAQSVLDQQGGTLSLTLDPNDRGAGAPSTTEPEEFYYGNYAAVFEDFTGTLPGMQSAVSEELIGHAYVPVTQLSAGGFDALDVKVRAPGSSTSPYTPDSISVVEFTADTELSLDRRLTLDAAIIRASDNVDVALHAPYIAMGSSQNNYRIDGSEPDAVEVVPGQFDNYSGILTLAPSPGDASLYVEGDLIELVGELITEGIGQAGDRLQADGSLNGQAGVEFVAHHDFRVRGVRLDVSDSTKLDGPFRSAGDVTISAERIYPATLTDFELSVLGNNGSIEFINLADATPYAPLSIGGSLAINADHIHQGGNIFAPLGRLEFSAGERLQLSAGSLTSSSGFGVEAPFFTTQPGGDLVLPGTGNNGDIIFVEAESDAVGYDRVLPEQFVLLDGPNIDVEQGASFDLRGGSDARTTEFIPGPGGSRDILLADLDTGAGVNPNNSFAIIPGIGEFAPYDPLLTPAAESVQAIAVGDTIVLAEGMEGLPAGEYAILPARYALFGGYLVTPVAGSQNMATGLKVSSPDGSNVLAGRYGVAGNDTVSSHNLGFAIADGEMVRNRAQYLETALADTYSEGNVRTPEDAGTLSIEAQTSLQLAGQLVQGGGDAGRGSRVNIVADAISILDQATGTGIELEVAQLEQLGADSLLIGGRSTTSADGLVIESAASEINVAAGVELDVPELILVADDIDVQSSADRATRLQSTQPANEDSERLIIAGDTAGGINGDAAVVAVSNRTLTLERAAPTGANTGQLVITPNATLQASGSVVADVAGTMVFNGKIEAEGALVNLGASSVSLGETDGHTISNGLVLSNTTLTSVAGSRLRLRSDDVINVYGRLFNTDSGADLVFDELNLDGRGLIGLVNDNDSVRLVADTFTLSNSTGNELANAGATSNGSELIVNADRINLADGAFKVQGYESVNMKAGRGVQVSGDGELLAEALLEIDAPVISGRAGADYSITAQDARLTVTGADPLATLPAGSGLAASLLFQGNAVDFGGRVVLPSGHVRIHQLGDVASPVAGDNVDIRSAAIIDVAGITQQFGPETFVTGGGSIQVSADTGDINVAADSTFNVSAGAAIGEAGAIQFESPEGVYNVSPDAAFIADGTDGGFLLDTDTFNVGGISDALAYTELSQLLGDNFGDQRSIRLRSQGMVHDENLTVRAHDVRLVSDTGSIIIHGTIDASGQGMNTVRENGGSIVLAAGDVVDVESTAVLRATGTPDQTGSPETGSKGGRIEFFVLDADADDVGGTNDRVNLKTGAVIDVSGGDNPVYTADVLVTADQQLDGKVLVHTRMIDAGAGTFVQGDLGSTIIGAAEADIVATSKTTIVDDDIDSADITAIRNTIATFMQNTVASVSGFTVTPGILVEAAGNLTLQDEWNFYGADTAGGWHFGETASDPGVTGIVTLRAAGDITLQAGLTDSYFDDPGNIFFGIPDLIDRLDSSAEAWSYNIIAGSDLASADPRTTGDSMADLTLNDGVVVRTGTGDISVVAGNNISLGADAAIYTGGYDRGLSQNMLDVMPGLETGFFSDERKLNKWMGGGAIFPVDGGNVSVSAAGSITGTTVPDLPSEWQPRIGEPLANDLTGNGLINEAGAVPTNWGIAFHRFTGIGALGGGELEVRAGGDLNNVALAIPTSGRTIAGAVDNTGKFAAALETTEVAGGGILHVDIAGDVNDGQFYLGDGVADIRIDGDSGNALAGTGTQVYTGFDGRFKLVAGGELNITEIQDPGTVPLSDSQGSLTGIAPGDNRRYAPYYDNKFFTYTDSATTDLHALSGRLTLSGTQGIINAVSPALSTISHSSDLVIKEDLFQFPSHQGQLQLLAQHDLLVTTGTGTAGIIELVQSDQEAALQASILNPVQNITPVHAEQPVHANDDQPSLIVARNGSIYTSGSSIWSVRLAEATHVQAGLDIINMSANVQNNRADDVTSFIAGRDIRQLTQRDTDGTFKVFTASQIQQLSQFKIAGPGTAEFIAGRNINLGTSDGIETTGNINNRFLPDEGADLILMAGLGGDTDIDSFVQSYFVDGVEAIDAETGDSEIINYQQQLMDYLAQHNITILGGDAVTAFNSLDARQQRALIADVLFTELRESGVYALDSGSSDYSRGFNAINILFPQNDPDGGISMLLSQVQTLDGGDIDMLVPGGLINAGTASSDIIAKGAADLGIVTAQHGDVNIMVDGDLLVNSTRVFALQGDLTVWSSNGDIDAGKGAKTATSVPAPITRIGPTGETITIFPPAIVGSGLQGENAFLFAPKGIIDAGDAGIRTIGNLTLGATAVIGADNIDVGGVSVGVPTAPAGVSAGVASAGNAASSATSLADDSTSFGNEDEGSTTLGILSVNVEGFGDIKPAAGDNHGQTSKPKSIDSNKPEDPDEKS